MSGRLDALERYAEGSKQWAHGQKTEDELLQRIWNLAGDVLLLVEIAKAAREAEDLWNARMLGASVVIPARDDPDPLSQAWYRLQDALARLDATTTEQPRDSGKRSSGPY